RPPIPSVASARAVLGTQDATTQGGNQMTVDQTQAIDEAKLNELLGRFVNDFGAAGFAATVVIGDKLGLYQALATGPATPAELAERPHTPPRLVAEWLAAQAASGYVTYNPDGGQFSLS